MSAEHSESSDIFCRISADEVEVHTIYETDDHLGILAHNGNTEGFSVIFPREHHPSRRLEVSRSVRRALDDATTEVEELLVEAFEAVGSCAVVWEGCGINHLHTKVIPLLSTDGEWRHIPAATWKSEQVTNYPGYVTTEPGPPQSPDDLRRTATRILGQ